MVMVGHSFVVGTETAVFHQLVCIDPKTKPKFLLEADKGAMKTKIHFDHITNITVRNLNTV